VFITCTVVSFPKKDESVIIVADFNALNYQPVAAMNAPDAPAGPTAAQDLVQADPLEKLVHDRLSGAEADPSALLNPGADAGAAGLSQFAPRPTRTGATFVGVSSSNARKVVYAIDASGSMIAYLQIVVDELARSLSNLSPQQSFGVVFFQGNSAIEVPPAGKLIPATAEEKSRALQWIKANVVPSGGTNPMVAIEKAIALKPDVIFLLSQDITGYGQFEVDQQELLAMLDAKNPRDPQTKRRAVQINCIQFLDSDPLDTMKAIVAEHGGSNGYKFLSRQELGLGAP